MSTRLGSKVKCTSQLGDYSVNVFFPYSLDCTLYAFKFQAWVMQFNSIQVNLRIFYHKILHLPLIPMRHFMLTA